MSPRLVTVLFSAILSLAIVVCGSRDTRPRHADPRMVGKNPDYDEKLATTLHSDEYGMSRYVVAFLKVGPNQGQDSLTAAKLQQAHLKNIQRMADEGKLVLAGPFLDEGEIRGIYVFDAASIEEAKQLTETDPAVPAGRLIVELHPWYGSAALKRVNAMHKALAKKAF